jgi:hypothetical protein
MEVQMQRTSGVWKRIAVVAFLAVGGGIVHGQDPGVPAMTAERSWQIQSVLQGIDAEREAWVNLLVSKWASALNPSVYDVGSELGRLARNAPAWQVYGASLAADFRTAVQILRGTRNAGPYIAGLPTSGASGQFELTPQVIGGSDFNQLVYNTVSPPCRVVDTRNAGPRTGPILANQTRSFDLTTDAETEGQGGGPFPCPGLPSFHNIGWALNITVLGNGPYTTHGGLKQWPFSGPEPNASVINWTPGLNGAIANGIIATGCPGCADSISIKNFGADPTHVIVDVMGFFEDGTISSSTVTSFAGLPVSVASGSDTAVNGGTCPAGTVLIGGEVEHANTSGVAVSASRQRSSTQWGYMVFNSSGSPVDVTAYSRCQDTPIKVN